MIKFKTDMQPALREELEKVFILAVDVLRHFAGTKSEHLSKYLSYRRQLPLDESSLRPFWESRRSTLATHILG